MDSRPPSQELTLLRVCLGINVISAVLFMPFAGEFFPPSNLGWFYLLLSLTIVYSLALFRWLRPGNYRLVSVSLIALLTFSNTAILFLHLPEHLFVVSILEFMFIVLFNVLLVSWPELLVTDVVLYLFIAGFVLLPGSGFQKSIRLYGFDPATVMIAVLTMFALLLILGTGMVEIKRRTEKQLRRYNETLNRRVEEKVAEIRKKEKDVQQSQKQLSRILQNIPVGVVILDARLNVLYSNGVHFPPVQTDQDGSAGAGRESCFNLDALHAAFLNDAVVCKLEAKTDLIGQKMERADRSGQPRLIRCTYVHVQLPDESEDLRTLVLITEDITHEEAIREKMIRTNHLAGMGKMAASLVHEVNNPLAGIKLNLELLEMGFGQPDKQKQMFDSLNAGVERIDRIVKSFLAFSRQEHPKKTQMDVHEVLREVMDMTVNFKPFHRVTIQCDFAPEMPLIYADRYRLEQVFVNLLNNACDAIGKKNSGVVDISTGCEENAVRIQFKDNGIGIKKEDLPHIFSPFFTTKERGYGTGLGLAISYGIIQEHGGTIEVESREGMGTTFIIRLPREGEGNEHDLQSENASAGG